MNLSDAIALFIKDAARMPRMNGTDDAFRSLSEALDFFRVYAARSNILKLTNLTPQFVLDFLSRGYIEANTSAGLQESNSIGPGPSSILSQPSKPPVHAMIEALAAFMTWLDRNEGTSLFALLIQEMPEIEAMLDHALRLGRALTAEAATNRGAFGFPEFLTSFEDGGRSQYDLDAPAGPGALDGYFRILRASGSELEAVEIISEEKIGPIIVSTEAALLCAPDYVVNLELISSADGWRITDCGFAYPPGFGRQ